MPKVELGTTDVAKVYLGGTLAQAVYLGSTKVWPSAKPAPTYINSSSAGQVDVSSFTCNYPAGTVSGDVLIMGVHWYRQATTTAPSPTTPSGWNLIGGVNGSLAAGGSNGSTSGRIAAYWRRRGAETSVSLQVSTDFGANASILAYSNATCHATAPIDAWNTAVDNPLSTTPFAMDAPSVDVVNPAVALALFAGAVRHTSTGAPNFTWGSGSVERTELGRAATSPSNVGYFRGGSATDSYGSAGATGTRALNSSVAAGVRLRMVVAIRPPDGALMLLRTAPPETPVIMGMDKSGVQSLPANIWTKITDWVVRSGFPGTAIYLDALAMNHTGSIRVTFRAEYGAEFEDDIRRVQVFKNGVAQGTAVDHKVEGTVDIDVVPNDLISVYALSTGTGAAADVQPSGTYVYTALR